MQQLGKLRIISKQLCKKKNNKISAKIISDCSLGQVSSFNPKSGFQIGYFGLKKNTLLYNSFLRMLVLLLITLLKTQHITVLQ
jgi:hypothetical protein